MIQDLKNIFGKFDKVAKSDTLLYDPKFDIAITNLRKTVNTFFIRFTSTIAPLNFINQHKISNL